MNEKTDLKGSKTAANLKKAVAGESMAHQRYLFFSNIADVLGDPKVASLFRTVSMGETTHAAGHLRHLTAVGDPATDLPFRTVRECLVAAEAGETHEYTDMYPHMAQTAREEGFLEIADWFETLARAERSHAGRFRRALDELEDIKCEEDLEIL